MEITKHYTWHDLLGYTPKKHERKRLRHRPFTVFVDNIPTVMDLLGNIQQSRKFTVKFGITYLHPDDEFVRKTGSEIARKKAKDISIELEFLRFYDGIIEASFSGAESFVLWYDTEGEKTGVKLVYTKGFI